MEERLNSFINERSDGDLAMFCKEIYDWHATGNLSKDSYIHRIATDFSCSCNYVEELVLDKSVEKLGKIVLLLLERRSSEFLKIIPSEQ